MKNDKNKLLKDIQELVINIEKTKVYKSKDIYALYNQAYNKNEQTSTCISCLRNRVNKLKKYLETEVLNPTHYEEEIETFIKGKIEDSDAVILTTSDWKGEITDNIILQKPTIEEDTDKI
ncbi:hypothetical protein EZS27_004667 [termite gut metagenome]|uniref:Uncharacterized protein n=1 Tax=termite gut metagenome TaxID=433724 RepID=A0A5J4SPG3_9ZZZZ